LLQQIQRIAKKIHLGVSDNDKRLKNAELMLSQTAFRLSEMLQASSVDDRPLVEQTLAQVTDAKNAALLEVFRGK
jgi:argininosuccinate lyase